ncbi:MAG: pyridoxamine 5'-phosphate oxidase family protein [Desulfuromonadales bacterium]|nr:MAG: pyridoxamine 5'-phosphate oxidase family protein [Desulfuromonadales bacterium]
MRAIADLFARQTLAVLATDMGGHPYASLVAFAATADLRRVVFATIRTTRKFANLELNSRVSLLVDNRSNTPADFQEAAAVTVMGQAAEPEGAERERFAALYLSRHPYLEEFIASPTCALFVIEVERCVLVSRFQNVAEITFPP